MRVLIVNNSPGEPDILCCAIGFLGFSADHVESGAEAIQCHLRQRHDLVLLSMNLPDYDICSTAQAIRQLERTEPDFTPSFVCGLVPFHDGVMQENCLKSGMDSCVTEPRSPLEAIELLHLLHDKSRRIRRRLHLYGKR